MEIRKHALEEVKQPGRSPEIKVHAYSVKEDFERASRGTVESREHHGCISRTISGRIYVTLEGEGGVLLRRRGGSEDEVVPAAKDAVVLISKGCRLRLPGEDAPLLEHHVSETNRISLHGDGRSPTHRTWSERLAERESSTIRRSKRKP